MLRSGARWRDCPPEYGPYTTNYNRFKRLKPDVEATVCQDNPNVVGFQ
jgi:transposase